jgi:hypothetical protein
MRVVVEILRLADRRERQACALHDVGELVGAPVGKPLAQLREQLRSQHDALVVGGVRRVRLEIGEAQHIAERHPLRVADGGEENLLAAGNGEHVVIAHGLSRAGIGCGCRPVTANCSMCCPIRNTLFSYSADCTSIRGP